MNKNKDSFDFMGFFLKTDDINEEKIPEISKNTVSSTRHSYVKGRYIILVLLLLIITIGVAYGSWFVYDKLSTYFSSENEEQSTIAIIKESQPPAELSVQNGTPPDQVESGKEISDQNAKLDPTAPENSEITKPDVALSESSKVIAPEDRKPLLLEGKKTLFQRVLTRPGAVIYSQIPNLNAFTQTIAEEYVLLDANVLSCKLEGFLSENIISTEKNNLVTGIVESLVCAGKKIPIKNNMIENGVLETVDFGIVKVKFNSSDQGSSYLLWMKPNLIKALIGFVGNLEMMTVPPRETLG